MRTNYDDGTQLFTIPGLGTVMYVFMGITLDATLEAVRELRKVPEFQRHEGKRALNKVHKLVCECDDRMCRLIGDKDLAWLEDTKDIFISEVEADLMKYRISISNIIGRSKYPYPESYSYAVIAQSLARITSELEEEMIFDKLGATAVEGLNIFTTTNALKGYYRLFGTQQIDKAMNTISRIFDKDKRFKDDCEKCESDMRNIDNGAKIIVSKVFNCERIMQIANNRKALAQQ